MDLTNKDVIEAKTVLETTGHVRAGGALAMAVLEMPQAEKMALAKTFAEGSTEYEKWMLNMWNNGIPTLAGCSGVGSAHDKPSLLDRVLGNHRASTYSCLIMTPENYKKVTSVLEQLSQEDFNSLSCSIADVNSGYNPETVGEGNRPVNFQRRKKDDKYITTEQADAFFSILNNAFEKAKQNGLTTETDLKQFVYKVRQMNVNGYDNFKENNPTLTETIANKFEQAKNYIGDKVNSFRAEPEREM